MGIPVKVDPVSGTVTSQPAGFSPSAGFTAEFLLDDGKTATFAGTVDSPVTSFDTLSGGATLTFVEESQLSGEGEYSGTIGGGSFSVDFGGYVTISGTILGGPSGVQSIAGVGMWRVK